MTGKTVLTIAAGAEAYQRMAHTLARSFRVHHPDGQLKFVLVTDHPESVPLDLAWVEVRPVLAKSLDAFCHKLHLDEYCSGLGQTLFIDSDCLIVGSLTPVFDAFCGRQVSAIGGHLDAGEWCGDIAYRCTKLGLGRLPVFNGGVYFINSGPVANAIFKKARELRNRYDDLGITLLAGHHNEEPLVSLAMELFNELPIVDDATIKVDAVFVGGPMVCDVRRGAAITHLRRRMWMSDEKGIFRPKILHFNSTFTDMYVYRREARSLERRFLSGWPWWLARSFAVVASLPSATLPVVRDSLRPLYRMCFGVRKVNQGERGKALSSN